MAARTPGLQARSQYHSYWGTYAYTVGAGVWANGSNLLPGAPGNVISAAEFAKLEIGDIASTSDATIANRGLYVCVDTSGGNGLVQWARLDNAGAAVQTIRDAHVIVVAQQGAGWTPTTGVPATDALLNLNPQVAGIAADFIDPGDGTGLTAAITAATALSGSGTPCDIRLRPCNINLNTGAVLGPLALPQSTRLVGSADNQSAINGRNGAGEDQRILTLALGAQVEKIQFISQAPAGAPIGAGGLVETLGAGCDIVDCVFNFSVGATARTTLAGVDTTTVASGGQRVVIDRCRFINGTGGSHRLAFGTDLVGVRTRGSQVPGATGVAISTSVFIALDTGIEITVAPGGDSRDVAVSQASMTTIYRAGISVIADAGQGRGYRFTDVRVSFDLVGAGVTPQVGLEFSSLNNLGAIDQASVMGCTVSFVATSTVADRNFARLTGGAGSNGVSGVKLVACGIENSTATAPATDAVVLSDDVLRGGDILCDWNNITTDAISILSGTPVWEHAHQV